MWVRSLDWEDLLEKGMTTHSSILAYRNPMDRGAWWATVHNTFLSQLMPLFTAMQETWIRPLGREDPLEKEMSTHSSILAWKIPWTEELGGLQSMGSQRVRHD